MTQEIVFTVVIMLIGESIAIAANDLSEVPKAPTPKLEILCAFCINQIINGDTIIILDNAKEVTKADVGCEGGKPKTTNAIGHRSALSDIFAEGQELF